ncbi:MAG: carbamoyl-phosphate synthase domain-containing protein, partial [Candidatus Saccharimonadaceae bacterium]|nr:carbamoyl-phosphate synthase domain-containing protein [Candidatus Saccharimonadaceae bacterium]
MQEFKKVKLILENGIMFQGMSFGYEKSTSGEIVFNTAMVGYPESLTDPSYAGQILTATFPLVGNYGVPPEDTPEHLLSTFYESEKIHVKGLIISDYSFEYSHWNARKSLSDWLKEQEIPAIFGIDTRELTKIIRESGAMKAKIEFPEDSIDFLDVDDINWVAEVSCKEIRTYGNGNYKIVLVDCGTKNN